MTKPELTESAKRTHNAVLQSIINRATDDEIKSAALNLQRLMIEKGMDTPKPPTPKALEQLEYIEGRKSGTIQRVYAKQ